ncbi:WD repeat-containing protein 62, partial [Anas platyrhynchos]
GRLLQLPGGELRGLGAVPGG